MGHERTLVTRWTRRDWLAVAIIALTTTFLVGTSVMILATGTQIEEEIRTLDGLDTAEFVRGDEGTAGGVELPVATAETANGASVVVGVPNRELVLNSTFDNATLPPPPPEDIVRRGNGSPATVRLEGRNATLTRAVRPAQNRSALSDRWYVANRLTVRELGRTGAYRIHPDGGTDATRQADDIPDRGTLLLGTPAFLVGGGRELLQLLGFVTVGSGLLVGVTVYSVTRMTVRDRRRTLLVIRSTGGTRPRLVGLFSARAGLLTAAGAVFGYAFGVIAVSAILNVGTYFGTLTTLDVSGSTTDWLLIGAMLCAVVLIGAVAGALSVVRTAFAPPGTLMRSGARGVSTEGVVGRFREVLGVRVVGLRTFVPMTATLTVLVAIGVISVSVGLTLAPIAGATDGVVMSPDASYPLESEVDRDLANSFRDEGVPASPEVLLPQVRDGQGYVLRGVNYTAYTRVSDVRIIEGEAPTRNDHAVIGTGLAETLDIDVGDNVTVGGGTSFGIERVTVVGRFDGAGYLDDQLVVSLGLTQRLANLDSGTVQIVRTTGVEKPPEREDVSGSADIVVTGVSAPGRVTVGDEIPIDVTLRNRGDASGNRTISVPAVGGADEETVKLVSGEERSVSLTASFDTPGTYDIAIGAFDPRIAVRRTPADISVTNVSVPETAIANESVPVNVTLINRGGRSGSVNVSVAYGNTTRERTVSVGGNRQRTATVNARFDATGEYDVTVEGFEDEIRVVEPTVADIVVTDVSAPATSLRNTSVPVSVRLTNRGDLSGSRTLNLSVPEGARANESTVSVDGGESRVITIPVSFGTAGNRTISLGGFDADVRVVASAPASAVGVIEVRAPETAVVDTTFPVAVTIRNEDDVAGAINLTVPYNGKQRETRIVIGPNRDQEVTLTAAFATPGEYNVTVGGQRTEIGIEPTPADIAVTGVSVPETGITNTSIPVNVALTNRGGQQGAIRLTLTHNETQRNVFVTVDGRETRTVTLEVSYARPGHYDVTLNGFQRTVRVIDAGGLRLSPLPDRAPPNGTLLATLRNRSGVPVPGVRFRIGESSARTDENGTARIAVPSDPGAYNLRSRIGNRTVHEQNLRVRENASRSVFVELDVAPERVGILDEARVTATAYSPWGRTLSREIVLRRQGGTVGRLLFEMRPGENVSGSTAVEPVARGGEIQQVSALIGGERVANTTYTVSVPDRLAALLVRRGLYEPGSGLVASLEQLIGNFQILQGTLLGLGFLMGVGTTATIVIQAVHARRRTLGIQQATGASPEKVIRIVLGDGLRLGAVASVAGVVGGYAGLTILVEAGYTVLFGVRIAPLANAWLIGGLLAGGIVLVGTSALIAAWWILRVNPGALLTESNRRTPDTEDPEAPATEGG